MRNRVRGIRSAIAGFFDNLPLFPKYLLSHGIVVIFTALIISLISLQIARKEMESYAKASAQTVMAQTSLILEKSDSDLQKSLVAQLEQMGIYKLLRQQQTLANPVFRVRLERQLRLVMSANHLIRSALFISPTGQEILVTSDGSELDASLIQNFPREKVSDLHGRAYWYTGGGDRIFMSKVLYDLETTADLGMLCIGIDSSFFKGISSIDYYRGLGSVFIVSADSNEILFGSKSNPNLKDKLVAWLGDGRELPSHFKDGRVSYLLSMQATNDTDWKIINVISTSELISLSARIRGVILETTLVILIAALVMAALLVRSEVGKITALVKQTQRIARGDFDLDVGFHTKDELGQLAGEISSMASKLGELVNRVANERNQATEAKLRALHFEYNALQSSINPHFIANTLEFINSYAKIYHVPQVGEAACLLGDLMRESIRHKNDLITLDEELGHCRIYLKIQELLRESTLDIQYVVDDEVRGSLVPNMIIQPVIENAIIHGVEPKVGNARISIVAVRRGGDLVLSVTDNGVGIQEERLALLLDGTAEDDSDKIGLKSVDKRIKILFGQSYGVRIQSKDGEGTKVVLVMPFRRDRKEKIQ
ncbi:MAG TPA: histidine kinase [Spirochaetales bacterium]|nr:histidine kinase [Spirochaetales bacterium]